MKRSVRIPVLSAIILITLIVAVLPAMASPAEYILSFERDLVNDGEPDFWNLRGDVDWVCFDRMLYHGYCGVIFHPSGDRSMAYIGENESGYTTNEEGFPGFFEAAVVSRDLESNRVFVGFLYRLANGGHIKIYGPFPGGTYKGWIAINGIIDNNGNGLSEPSDDFVAIYFGVLAEPGSGRILVDIAYPNP